MTVKVKKFDLDTDYFKKNEEKKTQINKYEKEITKNLTKVICKVKYFSKSKYNSKKNALIWKRSANC